MIVAKGGRTDLSKGLGSGISLDAWGRQKVIEDYSLLHSIFTYDIPKASFKELFNGSELIGSFNNASSVNGKLHLEAGATLDDDTVLRSFRNPRYEPNRGHIYSISAFMPSPTALGVREFGIFTEESGVFFRLKSDGDLYAVYRTTLSGTGLVETEEKITIPFDLDLAMGNIFDIQFQWRGVGNISFYIGNPTTGVSELVYTFRNLNKSAELTMFNPALPISFRCENLGDNVVFECGCVDVSTEGGKNYDGTYGSLTMDTDSGSVDIPGPSEFNTAILAMHSKNTLNGLINTRDVLNLGLTAYADQRCVVGVWITRDSTAVDIGTQTWTDYRDANLEYVVRDSAAGTPMSLDITKAEKQFSSRVNIDEPFPSDAVFSKAATLNITPGDYIVFTMHRENGGTANVGVTYEFSEEV